MSKLLSKFLLRSLAILALATSPLAAQGEAGGPAVAKITNFKILSCSADKTTVTFRLAILGENLPTSGSQDSVQLDTKDPGQPAKIQNVGFVSPKEIDLAGETPLGTVLTAVKVQVGSKVIVSPDGLSVAFKASADKALKEFTIKLDHQKNTQFPNLHSVIVTKDGGDGGFDVNPNHMRVELEPAGATDLRVVQSNADQMELHFVAAADYEPKNVLVTVFDCGDLDVRQPVAVAKPSMPPVDPNVPTIAKVQTLFVDRGAGVGRIRIYGKKFGIKDLPSFPVDEYLCNCEERLNIDGYRNCGILGDDHGPIQLDYEQPAADSDTNYATGGEKGGKGQLQMRVDRRAVFCAANLCEWNRYQEKLRGQISVGVNSRNIDIRVEKAEIINANDSMIDVYFEFTRHHGYAWPFRLGGVDLTISKTVNKTEQSVPSSKVLGEVDRLTPSTFTISQVIGPAPDPDLTYQYTVLDGTSAENLLGQGVADNFFVLQLSVVNHGKKKVAIPLASIQAEVEWLHGFKPLDATHSVRDIYIEGPITVAPIPLASVSAYFGAYQKKNGTRTVVFNILDGITTLATALIPFSGSALKDANMVLSGGFIPGLRQSWVDLSAQQLQNLTSLSWESTETLAAGEALSKYIYIQRKKQFQDEKEPIAKIPRRTDKHISNIMALDITGFEVPDTTGKQGTPAATSSTSMQQQPAAATTTATATDSKTASQQ
jgi:hypothetical protein